MLDSGVVGMETSLVLARLAGRHVPSLTEPR